MNTIEELDEMITEIEEILSKNLSDFFKTDVTINNAGFVAVEGLPLLKKLRNELQRKTDTLIEAKTALESIHECSRNSVGDWMEYRLHCKDELVIINALEMVKKALGKDLDNE